MFNNSEIINEFVTKNTTFVIIQAAIGLIGIICNILAICVFERKQLKKHSYSFYWKVKAFMDSWLHVHTFRRVTNHFLNVDIDLISPFFCRFNEYQPFVACTIAVFIETMITLDRYLLIVHKDQFKIFKTRSFRVALISFIVVYSLLANIHLPLYYRLDEVSTTNGTTQICHIPNREWKINSTIFLINIISISFIINPILDIKLIYHIFSTRNQERLFTRSAIINRNFAISAIGLNMNNVIIELPIFIGAFFSEFFNFRAENIRVIFSI